MAILPISGTYDSAREDVEEVVAKVLIKSRRVEKVVPPDQVTDTFQTTKDAFDALVTYFSRMETTGQSDKNSAIKIGYALGADSLLVVKVNAWEYTREEGDNIARVGLSMRLVDAVNGAIVWKARHQVQESYLFIRPDMKDLATKLATDMIKYMPPESVRIQTFRSRPLTDRSPAQIVDRQAELIRQTRKLQHIPIAERFAAPPIHDFQHTYGPSPHANRHRNQGGDLENRLPPLPRSQPRILCALGNQHGLPCTMHPGRNRRLQHGQPGGSFPTERRQP